MSPYDKAYFEENQQINDRPALRWYAQVCRRLLHQPGLRVFDFGCGVGWLLYHLKDKYSVYGYDISEYCRNETRRRISKATIYDELGNVPGGVFDLVVSLHVLEHVPDPAQTIRQLASYVCPGGYLLFVVPANNGLGHRLRGTNWFAYRDETHISLLDEHIWRQHVVDAGLEVVQEAGDGLWDPPYVPYLPRMFQLPLFGFPAAFQVYLGRGRLWLPVSWSECLIMVARKHLERP